MADESRNSIYVVGAGFTGTTIAAEIRAKRIFGRVVAFLDDDSGQDRHARRRHPRARTDRGGGPRDQDDPRRRGDHRHSQRDPGAACADLRHPASREVRPDQDRPPHRPDPGRGGAPHPGPGGRSRGFPRAQPCSSKPPQKPLLRPGEEGAGHRGGREHRVRALPAAPGGRGGKALPLRTRGKQHLRDPARAAPPAGRRRRREGDDRARSSGRSRTGTTCISSFPARRRAWCFTPRRTSTCPSWKRTPWRR